MLRTGLDPPRFVHHEDLISSLPTAMVLAVDDHRGGPRMCRARRIGRSAASAVMRIERGRIRRSGSVPDRRCRPRSVRAGVQFPPTAVVDGHRVAHGVVLGSFTRRLERLTESGCKCLDELCAVEGSVTRIKLLKRQMWGRPTSAS